MWKGGSITIIHGLEVVHEGQDILVAHGHTLQHGDLVAHHVFAPSHKALVDNLGGIVAAGFDVYTLLDHAVRARAQRFARLVPARLHLRRRRRRGACGHGLAGESYMSNLAGRSGVLSQPGWWTV